MSKVFERHGAETTLLLNPSAPLDDENAASISAYLTGALKRLRDEVCVGVGEQAIRRFFRETTPRRIRYIAQLLDGTLTYFALTVNDVTSNFLRGNLEPLAIFIDTNFIFAILELSENTLYEISKELVDFFHNNKFPAKLYYHQATLDEFRRTIAAMGAHLKYRTWVPALSRAAIACGNLNKLELAYHTKNATSPLDPEVFLYKYDYLPQMLAEYGFELYQDTSLSGADVNTAATRRALLVADYKDFIDHGWADRPKPYAALNHDIEVWMAVSAARHIGARLSPAPARRRRARGRLGSCRRWVARSRGPRATRNRAAAGSVPDAPGPLPASAHRQPFGPRFPSPNQACGRKI